MQNTEEGNTSSNIIQEDPPSKATKLVQIIEDTIQILVDDYELMQDDYGRNYLNNIRIEGEQPSEINAEEIVYDVLKVLEDCKDPELCLEMIVPVIGALQKYIINVTENPNLFLIQLMLHLL